MIARAERLSSLAKPELLTLTTRVLILGEELDF